MGQSSALLRDKAGQIIRVEVDLSQQGVLEAPAYQGFVNIIEM